MTRRGAHAVELPSSSVLITVAMDYSYPHPNNSGNEDELLIFAIFQNIVATIVLLLLTKPVSRAPSLIQQRLSWESFQNKHGQRKDFQRHIRLPSIVAFNKLLGFIREDLEVDQKMASLRGGAILPEIKLYCALRWLAGGSHSDIEYMVGISKASFYSSLWDTLRAINRAPELQLHFPQTTDECKAASRGFESVSDGGAIWRCVSVIDTRAVQQAAVSNDHGAGFGIQINGGGQVAYWCTVADSC